MTKPFTFFGKYRLLKYLSFSVLLAALFSRSALAQSASTYAFTATAGTFTDITGTAGLVTLPAAFMNDDATGTAIPIGFTFNYCGTNYTQVAACTNGWISFNATTTANQWTNSLANLTGGTAAGNIKPALMPLWDDLGPGGTGSSGTYVTTGTAPNRVFTFQWRNWQWNVGTGVNISFQVKLYETTNVIEYIYRQETASGSPLSATIGIADGAATPTYLVLNNSTATPTPSSITFTDGINTRPATGQVYRFAPPPPCTAITAPAAAATTAYPTSICVSGNTALSLPVTIPTATGITYQWQRSTTTPTGTYTTIGITTAPTFSAPVTTNSYYRCRVLCNNDSVNPFWTSGASAQVVISNPGSPTITAGSRCGPGSVALSASGAAGITFRWYDAASGGAPLFTGANFNTPYVTATRNFYVTSGTIPVPTNATVGAGALTPSFNYVTIFAGGWGGYKHQFLIRQSEMIAAGIMPGDAINSISVDNANGSGTYNGFTMSLKNTTVTDLTATFETGAAPVFGPVNYATSVGINTFTFGAPFTYTGGNLLIETCWSNGTTSNPYSNIRYDNTTFPSTHYAYQDNQTPAVICAGPSNNGTPENTRPQFKFNYMTVCQGPRVAVTATINSSTVVPKAFPAVVCNNSVATISLTPPTPGYSSYNWSPQTNLYTNAGATTPYTGGSATTVYMKTPNVGPQTYYLMAGDPTLTTGCTFADTLKVWVQPANVTIKGMPDTICVNGTTTLALDTISGYAPGSIQWQDSIPGTSTSFNDISGATNPSYTTPTLSFGQNRYYRALIRAGSSICQSPVKYVVIANPTLVSAPDSFHCGPGPVTLSAVTAGNGSAVWYDSPTSNTPLGFGSIFVTPYLGVTRSFYVASGGGGSAGTPAIGAGALVSGTQGVTPFSSGWGGSKHQFLILGSELVAAGIPVGAKLVSLAMEVVSGGTTYPGLAVSMKNTTTTSLPTSFEAGTVPVRLAAPFTTSTGVNTITFDASPSFVWTGGNLLIQTCWSNGTTSSNATGSTVNYDNTSYSATRRGQNDNITPADMCAVTGPSSSANYNQRPKFLIGYDNRCESAREEVVAYIRPVPVVNLGTDINDCVDSGAIRVLDAGVQPNTPQFLWDNGSASQVRAVSQSGTYYVKVTNQYTCAKSDTINVNLRKNPVVNLGNDTTVCNGVVLPLNAGGDGTSYYWNNGTTNQILYANGAGTYYVFVTNNLGCIKSDTIQVSASGELPTIDGINITNNGANTFHFTAMNPQNVIGYDWDFGDSTAHSYQAAPTHTYASNPANYVVVLKLSSSCGFLTDSTSAHIVGIHELNVGNDELMVYPNPAKLTATIRNKGNLKMEKVSVYNVLGQVVYQAAADSRDNHTLQLGAFAPGVYTIQIYTDKGTVARKLEIMK